MYFYLFLLPLLLLLLLHVAARKEKELGLPLTGVAGTGRGWTRPSKIGRKGRLKDLLLLLPLDELSDLGWLRRGGSSPGVRGRGRRGRVGPRWERGGWGGAGALPPWGSVRARDSTRRSRRAGNGEKNPARGGGAGRHLVGGGFHMHWSHAGPVARRGARGRGARGTGGKGPQKDVGSGDGSHVDARGGAGGAGVPASWPPGVRCVGSGGRARVRWVPPALPVRACDPGRRGCHLSLNRRLRAGHWRKDSNRVHRPGVDGPLPLLLLLPLLLPRGPLLRRSLLSLLRRPGREPATALLR